MDFSCWPCGLKFPSWTLFWEHKCAMRDLGKPGHKSCLFCGKEFEVARSELLHIQQCHEPAKDLYCPGCNQGPFKLVGTLIAHIERGQCTSISSKDLEEQRENKLNFHRELEKTSDEPVKGSFARYMSEASVTPWVDVVEAPSAEKPGDITGADFPALISDRTYESSGTKNLDETNKIDKPNKLDEPTGLYSADKPDKTETPGGTNTSVSKASKLSAVKWQGAWGSKYIQAAIAKDRDKRGLPTTAPGQQPTNAAASRSAEIVNDSMDLDDPESPYFNASLYFSSTINKYICPKLGCGKYYDTTSGITNHLSSSAHGPKTYECPKCSRTFKSAEAIMYHAESAGGRCCIRETEHYGAFVDQLTGGIVQAETNIDDDTVKYSINKNAGKKVFW